MDNPYWDEVEPNVQNGLVVTDDPDTDYRVAFAHYAWTVSDPDSVAFVQQYCSDKAIDPFAGSAYWAYLLEQLGIDVVCYDANPFDGIDINGNPHPLWMPVLQGQAEDVISQHPDAMLLLIGPPNNEPSAVNTLRAYQGDRLIFMGDRRSSGDDDLFALLRDEWTEIAEHIPVQWDGWNLDDRITVYERNPGKQARSLPNR